MENVKPGRRLAECAADYIEAHYKEEIHVRELADTLYISQNYLTRIFRQYTGKAPLHYIRTKRLEYACELLGGTDLTCEQIAEKVGLYDASHLHRLFVKYIGCPPSAYRRDSRRPAAKTG